VPVGYGRPPSAAKSRHPAHPSHRVLFLPGIPNLVRDGEIVLADGPSPTAWYTSQWMLSAGVDAVSVPCLTRSTSRAA
jgi:hypothetical protein